MWAPVSLGVSSKTLKLKVKFSRQWAAACRLWNSVDNSKRPFLINRFCDEYSSAAAMDPMLLRNLWPESKIFLRRSAYCEHVNKMWNSFSICLEEQLLHIFSCLGMFVYLPFRIFKSCDDVRNFVSAIQNILSLMYWSMQFKILVFI
jgi:hypothetical protein